MNCPNCGAPLEDGAQFCGSCGAQVPASEPTPVEPAGDFNAAPEQPAAEFNAAPVEPAQPAGDFNAAPTEPVQPEQPAGGFNAAPTQPQPQAQTNYTNNAAPAGGQVDANGTPFIIWSIVSILFCCLPFGIVALIQALKIGKATSQFEADEATKKAKLWNFISLGAGVIYIIITIIVVVSGSMNF